MQEKLDEIDDSQEFETVDEEDQQIIWRSKIEFVYWT